MIVIKRDGTREGVCFDKIQARIEALVSDTRLPKLNVSCDLLTQEIIKTMKPVMTAAELDIQGARCALLLAPVHHHYNDLAARIIISNMHKEFRGKTFAKTSARLHAQKRLSDTYYDTVTRHADLIERTLNSDRDYLLTLFGYRTMERGYLLRDTETKELLETPQYLWMRVAFGIHGDDTDNAITTYTLLSQLYCTHATPTLFNAGSTANQLSSCFLQDFSEDSIEGIYNNIGEMAKTSQHGGGIAMDATGLRPNGSYIHSTGGMSRGIVPFLRVVDATGVAVDQGGRRKGSIAVYLQPWHGDIEEFLTLRLNVGNEKSKARDLFTGLWVPDLFMRQVAADGDWWLMNPQECPDLQDLFGDAFDARYMAYVEAGTFIKKMRAIDLWDKILKAQIETGMPYMCYKDTVNKKNNQSHLGTVRCSNLCSEIVQYSSGDETAVCNLASIALHRCVRDGAFDYDLLQQITRQLVVNLNKIIDLNYYPTERARKSNLAHRPMGIGVQGLQDVFLLLDIPFESPEAKGINKRIFENIALAANDQSARIAAIEGPYPSYNSSPMARGIMQHDMWGVKGELDWAPVRARIAKHGIRNSMLTCCMPTGSTAQILGSYENFEPLTSNYYNRKVLSGTHTVINHYLLTALQENYAKYGLDAPITYAQIRDRLLLNNGSIASIKEIPDTLKAIHKTNWEIKQREILVMSADRGPWVDQSQSLNIYFSKPDNSKISQMHFTGWRLGLKTGSYYLRTQSAVNAVAFTAKKEETPAPVCTDEVCEMCT